MLTDQECRSAKADGKPLKLFDGQGLYLLVSISGHKSWRFKYRFGGKEKLLTIGPYPEISLKQARARRDDARSLHRQGVDPAEEHRRATSRRRSGIDQARTFKALATRWHTLQTPGWKPKHAKDVLSSLENEVFPALGGMELREITPADVRELLIKVQARGATELAHRLRSRISAVYQLAIASDLVEFDPAASVGPALRPIQKRMHPALLKLKDARSFLEALEAEPGYPTTKLASRLLALTAARPGMVRFIQREDLEGLDTPEPVWRVPAAKMKLELAESEQEAFEFMIPLSRQAVETLKVAMEASGNRHYIFYSARHSHRPFSENALNANYRRVPGWSGSHVPHGWRASFSTIMNERAIDLDRPGDRAIIDLMLAHKPTGTEAHYNRAAYMKRRRFLAQEWADMLLEGFAPPVTLIEGRRKR